MTEVAVILPPTNLSLIEEQESLLVTDEDSSCGVDLVSTSCEGSSSDSAEHDDDDGCMAAKAPLDVSALTACTSPLSVLEDSGLVNTHTSILNITEDDDEEENDIDNVIVCVDDHVMGDGDFAPTDCDASSVVLEANVAVKETNNLVDQMMEQFVERLCVAPELDGPLNLCPPNQPNVVNTPPPPRRRTIKMRHKRVSQLMDHRIEDNGIPLKHIQSLQSMATKSSFDGYDSDPELNSPQQQQAATELDTSYYNVTQNCLNRKWTLKLQTGTTYEKCNVWMERGTLVRGHEMLEPRLCYRSGPTQQPSSIKLLHICRIRPATRLDIVQRPFAKLSCCMTIKTVQDKVFCFQAETTADRDAVLFFWKSTVARFAALAVLEDAHTLWHEFFVSAHSPPPLSTV